MYNDNIPNISWPLRQYNFFQSFFMSAKTSSYISFLGKGAVRCWNMDENWPTNIIGSGNSTILHPVSVAIYIVLAGRPLRPLVILPLLLGFHLDIYYKNPFRFFALLTLKCYGKNDVCIFEKLVTLYSFIAEFSEG